MYSAAVLDHFKNPRNAGDLPDATATVEVSNPACGDVLQLAARVEAGRLVSVRFMAKGCVTAVACGSCLTEMILGRAAQEAAQITAEGIADALGGLPATTQHGAHLAFDALRELLQKLDEER